MERTGHTGRHGVENEDTEALGIWDKYIIGYIYYNPLRMKPKIHICRPCWSVGKWPFQLWLL